MLNVAVSSIAPLGSATPIAPTVEVWTTRSTPAVSASSNRIRAPRVRVPDAGTIAPAKGGPAGDVEHPLDPGDGSADRSAVSDVARRPLELEPVERRQAGASPGENAQFVAALRERAGQVRADETGASGDERDPHRSDGIRGVN